MIDYQELLKKYIQHVLDEEGTDFISTWYHSNFTQEEADSLYSLSKYSEEERNRKSVGTITRSPLYQQEVKRLLAEELSAMPYTKVIHELV